MDKDNLLTEELIRENLFRDNVILLTLVFVAGAFFFFLVQTIINLLSKTTKVDEPSLMNTNVIQNMVNNYRNTQLTAVNNHLNIEDANSVWFDLRTVKKFISTVEIESQSRNGNINLKDLGVRFYYASYPKEENWDVFNNTGTNPPREYAQLHTLIMVPTLNMKDSSGNYLNYDFNPLDENTYTHARRMNSTSSSDKTVAASSRTNPINTVAQNHGNLIPPSTNIVQNY